MIGAPTDAARRGPEPPRITAPAGDPSVSTFAAGPVLAIAAVAVGVLLAVASRYGYHRDELYFLAASRHLTWGYVDQPPVAVAVAWLSRVALGDSLFGCA